ncbi:hypothetical protein [Marinitenerispora sediminis]|uniref:Uncharacterized protein n=1 Tax=Marinitenerispora sediminis TaxID=1931232 RepID=A0A368TBM4_9ACTN|nr:hypothetical protein [Marinitenerispora sediminis]RCV58172.1 hypothetical protein DEF28_00435 [Marinitenerispora sediminis]RCV61463.1 hypothetical protein DEF23_02250 [Marinitenerispora sediminis]RCV62543.1 hypothetical protein DEF24_00785 [Marinitenerispora sediminis]
MARAIFRDESPLGERLDAFELPDLPDSVTVRELIRLRVREEVARYNAQPSSTFQGLVRPTDAEAELNGYRMRGRRHIDWERQADIAEHAFTRNGFVVLVGDRQVEDLDESVALSGDPEIVFIKLVPLVGG